MGESLNSNILLSVASNDQDYTKKLGRSLATKMKNIGIRAEFLSISKLSASAESLLPENKNSSKDIYAESLVWMLDRKNKEKNLSLHIKKNAVTIIDRSQAGEALVFGSSIEQSEQRLGFYTWKDQMEDTVFSLQRPDFTFIVGSKNDNYLQEYTRLFSKESKFIFKAKNIDKTGDKILKLLDLKDNISVEANENEEDHVSQLLLGQLIKLNQNFTANLYIGSDKNDKNQFLYYTPKNLSAESAKLYETTIDKIYKIHSDLMSKTKASVKLANILPVAALSNVVLVDQDPHTLIDLRSSHLFEYQDYALKLAHNSKNEEDIAKKMQSPLIQYRNSTAKSIKEIAEQTLPQLLSAESDNVVLQEHHPISEMDLIPYMLYEHSNIALSEIITEVETWNYKKKSNSIKAYFGKRDIRDQIPSKALSQANYQWELITDFTTFKSINMIVNSPEVVFQELSPRYGYEVPKEIEELGVSDAYEKCFDLSFELYSSMQKHGYRVDAQYATLMGHRLRWSIKLNGLQLLKLLENRQINKELRVEMLNKLNEVHPLFASEILIKTK